MNRLQEIEARLAAIANEIEQRGAELTAEQLTAFETEVNNLKTERAGLVAAAEQRNNLLNSDSEFTRVNQDSLKFAILLLQFSKCWDCR